MVSNWVQVRALISSVARLETSRTKFSKNRGITNLVSKQSKRRFFLIFPLLLPSHSFFSWERPWRKITAYTNPSLPRRPPLSWRRCSLLLLPHRRRALLSPYRFKVCNFKPNFYWFALVSSLYHRFSKLVSDYGVDLRFYMFLILFDKIYVFNSGGFCRPYLHLQNWKLMMGDD